MIYFIIWQILFALKNSEIYRLSSFCNFFLIVNLIVCHMDLLQIVAFVNYLLQIAVSIKQLQQSH